MHVCVLSCSVVSDSVRPPRRQPDRLLCPWDFSGKNNGLGCHFLLQGIFPVQESKPHLLYWHADFFFFNNWATREAQYIDKYIFLYTHTHTHTHLSSVHYCLFIYMMLGDQDYKVSLYSQIYLILLLKRYRKSNGFIAKIS